MFVGIYLGSAAGLIPSLILTWLLGIFCLRLSRPLTVLDKPVNLMARFDELLQQVTCTVFCSREGKTTLNKPHARKLKCALHRASHVEILIINKIVHTRHESGCPADTVQLRCQLLNLFRTIICLANTRSWWIVIALLYTNLVRC